jgi:hypothetical protein
VSVGNFKNFHDTGNEDFSLTFLSIYDKDSCMYKIGRCHIKLCFAFPSTLVGFKFYFCAFGKIPTPCFDYATLGAKLCVDTA